MKFIAQGVAAMKVPIFGTTFEAYRFCSERLGTLYAIAAIPLALAVAVSLLADYVAPAGPGSFVGIAAGLAFGLVQVPFMTAWHRMTLLSREKAKSTLGFGFRRWEVAYIGYILGTVLLLLIAAAVPGFVACALLAEAGSSAVGYMGAVIIGLAGIAGVFWVTARLCLVFPGAALGAGFKAADSWRATRGNGWRILWVLLLCSLPPIAIASMYLVVLDMPGAGEKPNLAIDICLAVVGFYFGGVAISALSLMFRRLTGYDAASFNSKPRVRGLRGTGTIHMGTNSLLRSAAYPSADRN